MHNKARRDLRGRRRRRSAGRLDAAAERCVRAGIPAEHVILDPGIGFGKTPEHNLSVLGALPRLVALGFPTLLGTSRKSTIGRLTGRDVDGRAFGTAATVALAAAAGIDIVRVHDVPNNATSCASPTRSSAAGARPGWTRHPSMIRYTIELRGIRAFGHHGADPGEKIVAQPFDIDVDARTRSLVPRGRAMRLAIRWITRRCTRRSCGSCANVRTI